MKISELVILGIRGSVVALNRATGEQVWATHLKGYEFVNIVVEDQQVLATCSGEAFCLDPFTGRVVWHNRLKGFGRGLATIGTQANQQQRQTAISAAQRLRDEAAAAAGATACM